MTLLNVTASSVQFVAPSCCAVTLSLSILKPSVEGKPPAEVAVAGMGQPELLSQCLAWSKACPESLSRAESLALLAQQPPVLLHFLHSCTRPLVILICSHSVIPYSRVEPGLASSGLISLPSS